MRSHLRVLPTLAAIAVLFISAISPDLANSQPPATSPTETAKQIHTLKITVLSTMLVGDTTGIGEWGFSALVEADGHRILLDTGNHPETVLQNARDLKIDLSDVREVILTHNHGDHIGGLLTLRREMMKQNPRFPSCTSAKGFFIAGRCPTARAIA